MKLRKALKAPLPLAQLSALSLVWGADIVVRALKNTVSGRDRDAREIPELESDDRSHRERAMREHRPFILRDVAGRWADPDYFKPETIKTEWTDLLNVSVLDGHETFLGGLTERDVLMTPRELVERVFEGRATIAPLYLRMNDVPVVVDAVDPIGPYRLNNSLSALFVGAKGNVTRLHFDSWHNFLTQLHGRKKVVLFAPSQAFNLYEDLLGPTLRDQCTWLPETDCMSADRKRFKRLSKTERFETVLMPGDAVYIPPFWWHQITSLDAGVSIAVRYDLLPMECALNRMARHFSVGIRQFARRAGWTTFDQRPQYRSSELPEGAEPQFQLDPS